MKIEDIELFERIASLNAVSAGGYACGITPTVASDRLKRLEADLGCTLLNRTTRSLSLTGDGARFLDEVRVLLKQYQAVRHSVGRRAKGPTGTLRLTAPALFGRKFLPGPIQRFLSEFPNARLNPILTDDVLDYVTHGIDLAIRIGQLEDSTAVARKIADNRRIICAAPSYVARIGMPEQPSDLKRHNCLVFAGEDRWHLRNNGQNDVVHVSGQLETNSAEIVRQATLDGVGIALRSVWDVVDEIRSGRLVHILSGYEVPTKIAIWAIFPPGRFISPAAKIFAQYVKDSLETNSVGAN